MVAAKGDGGDRRPFSLLFLHFTKTHLFLSLPRVPILLYFERAHRRLSGSERRKMRRMTVGEAKFWLFLYLLSFVSLPWGSLIFSLCFLSNPLVSPSFSGEPSGVPATARFGEARKFWFEPRWLFLPLFLLMCVCVRLWEGWNWELGFVLGVFDLLIGQCGGLSVIWGWIWLCFDVCKFWKFSCIFMASMTLSLFYSSIFISNDSNRCIDIVWKWFECLYVILRPLLFSYFLWPNWYLGGE